MSDKIPNEDELKAKLAEIEERRAEKKQAYSTAAKARRLENEVKLGQIEADTGLTLGIDLGVVWAPDGSMVVAKMPPAIAHQQFFHATGKVGGATDQEIENYIKSALLCPTSAEMEGIVNRCPHIRYSVMTLLTDLASTAARDLEGK
jgi:hypothetical protein